MNPLQTHQLSVFVVSGTLDGRSEISQFCREPTRVIRRSLKEVIGVGTSGKVGECTSW